MEERLSDGEWRETLKYPKYKVLHLNEYIHNGIKIRNSEESKEEPAENTAAENVNFGSTVLIHTINYRSIAIDKSKLRKFDQYQSQQQILDEKALVAQMGINKVLSDQKSKAISSKQLSFSYGEEFKNSTLTANLDKTVQS